ncbi:hypothetical protein MT341_01330 [Staphylococcus sp. NRL 18/288]|nr:hypothetical protein [Staphylococcus sp. NRL 18/288]MCJ1661248.1 hypothetical protein [Staphylococcus sp. NRL 18/288]
MKKVLAGIVIVLLIVALGFSIFFAATHKNSNTKQDNPTEKHEKKEKHQKKKVQLKKIHKTKMIQQIMAKMPNMNQQLKIHNKIIQIKVTLIILKQIKHKKQHKHKNKQATQEKIAQKAQQPRKIQTNLQHLNNKVHNKTVHSKIANKTHNKIIQHRLIQHKTVIAQHRIATQITKPIKNNRLIRSLHNYPLGGLNLLLI